MKQCPRCKSILAKSHGQKLICRACGFVTKNIQVARDNQQFQQRHHFGKKITHSKYHDHMPNNKNNKQFKDHYLISFQNALRNAAINISKISNQFKNIQYHARYTWMAYLNLASHHNIDISGIFKKVIKNKNKITNKNQQQKEQKQQQQNNQQKQQQKQQEQDGYQNNIEQKRKQDQHIPEQKPKKRRGRRKKDMGQGLSTNQQKKVPLKTQIRRKWLQIKQNQQQLQIKQQAQIFLQFAYNITQQHIQHEVITSMASKYAIYLIRNLRHFNLNIGMNEVKGRTHKLTTKQLQTIISMRKLQFTDKNQMILVIMLEDLLRLWAQQLGLNNQYSLQKLLLLYKSPKNTTTKPTIDTTIDTLSHLMNRQQQKNKQLNDNKLNKIKFPELSISLLYAILYLSALNTHNCLSIDDVVLYAGLVCFRLVDQQVRVDQKVSNFRVRKSTANLIRILNLKCQPSTNSINKWVQKYAKICGIVQHIPRLNKLAEVLYNTYELSKKQQKQQFMIQKRYDYLQQDIMAKSIIIIYVKLQIGFQGYPYLSTFPLQIVDKIKDISLQQVNIQSFTNVLSYIERQRNDNILVLDIQKIINNIQSRIGTNSKRQKQLKLLYPAQNYDALSNLSMKNLIKFITRYSTNNLQFHANLANAVQDNNINNKDKDKGWRVVDASDHNTNTNTKQLYIRTQFLKQIQIAIRDYEQDVPAANYQLFYQYMSNIKHVKRDIFVLFAQTLAAGQCLMKYLYQWVQKFQKILIDFQN